MVRKALYILSILFATVTGIFAQPASTYEVSKLPFNDRIYSDIAPVIINDGILFCSNRRFSGLTDKTNFEGRRIYNIYMVSRKDTSDWSDAKELSGERSNKFNSGPLSIAPDGQTVYFTSEVETGKASKKRNFKNHNGIFIGRLSGSELVSITPFPYNSSQYDVAHPSVSNDGKYLFFASNMPGGQGKSDIWYCEMVNGEWSAPVNPGTLINSPGTESYPYYHPSGRLYFSSDRAGGQGRLDVYSTSMYDGKWDTPSLMPQPINSSADDFAFVASADMQTGYFSSNRSVNDDIFSFKSTIIRKSQCNELLGNSYCFEFSEENAVKFDTVPFLFNWRFSDGGTAQGIIVEHCFPGPGKFVVQLDVVNLVTGEVITNEKTDTLLLEDEIQPYITCADTVSAGTKLRLDAAKTNLPGWNIGRYYWNFGDETIAVGQQVEKMWSRPGVYNIQLIVNTSTDSSGKVQEACVSKNINVVP